ncbi:uncharacterized protein [Spinacia oleracea]|nr:uncharacterized protein LOC110800269 isoform X2 [Spinacia oleracea]XP_056695946.1 uncharacterized protein LOC110800269 isoform X2 [Spinacia oleracea]
MVGLSAFGKDPMPLVIGETLMGLDVAKANPSTMLSGSPVLLLVCLMERLVLVAPPENMESYNRKGFTMRHLMYGRLSLHEWEGILHESSIRWMVPWWGIVSMKYALGSSVLRVPSLTVLSFYSHVRVMRRFGLRQEIPDCAMENPMPTMLNVDRLGRWIRYWVAKPFLNVRFPPEPATLTAGYVVWMKGQSQR